MNKLLSTIAISTIFLSLTHAGPTYVGTYTENKIKITMEVLPSAIVGFETIADSHIDTKFIGAEIDLGQYKPGELTSFSIFELPLFIKTNIDNAAGQQVTIDIDSVDDGKLLHTNGTDSIPMLYKIGATAINLSGADPITIATDINDGSVATDVKFSAIVDTLSVGSIKRAGVYERTLDVTIAAG